MNIPDWRQQLANECRAFAKDLRVATFYAGAHGLCRLPGEERRLDAWCTTLRDRDSQAAAWFAMQVAQPLAKLREADLLGLPGADVVTRDPNCVPAGVPEGERAAVIEQQRLADEPRRAAIKAHAEKLSEPFWPIIRKLEAFADIFPSGQIPPYPRGEYAMNGAELEKGRETRPPSWTAEMWAAVQRFVDLPEGERAIVLDRWRGIVGDTVEALPRSFRSRVEAVAWWHATDNRRPDALAQAMDAAVAPPREAAPIELPTLRQSFPALLRSGSVANRIMAELLGAAEPLSVLRLAGGKGASGGGRANAAKALESLESKGLAVREGYRWKRGPATFRA